MDIQRRLRDPFDGDDRPGDRPGTDGDSETEPGLAGALVDISSSNMVGAHQRVVEPLEEATTSASFVHDAAPEQETVFVTFAADPAADQVGAAVTQSFSDVSGLGTESPEGDGVAPDELGPVGDDALDVLG